MTHFKNIYLSSSWSLIEIPRTGPALILFIKWVMKPAIWLRRRLVGMMAISRQIMNWMKNTGFDGSTFNNTLVGVEVKSEHHVVFFYDSSRGLLDSLCTNATHGEGLFFVPKSKIIQKLFDLFLNGKEQFYWIILILRLRFSLNMKWRILIIRCPVTVLSQFTQDFLEITRS